MAAYDGELAGASGDGRHAGAGVVRAACGEAEALELSPVASHLLDEQLEHTPTPEPGRREHRGDGGVAAACRLGHHAEAGPACAMVQIVESSVQVPLRARRDVRPGQTTHA